MQDSYLRYRFKEGRHIKVTREGREKMAAVYKSRKRG